NKLPPPLLLPLIFTFIIPTFLDITNKMAEAMFEYSRELKLEREDVVMTDDIKSSLHPPAPQGDVDNITARKYHPYYSFPSLYINLNTLINKISLLLLFNTHSLPSFNTNTKHTINNTASTSSINT